MLPNQFFLSLISILQDGYPGIAKNQALGLPPIAITPALWAAFAWPSGRISSLDPQALRPGLLLLAAHPDHILHIPDRNAKCLCQDLLGHLELQDLCGNDIKWSILPYDTLPGLHYALKDSCLDQYLLRARLSSFPWKRYLLTIFTLDKVWIT